MAESSKLKTLVITETSGKARALKKFLGSAYKVISTDGFLKDMPKTKIGMDENFEPNYITVRGKGPILQELKRESFNARKVYFATNLDGEGEFLAKQCCELFGVNVKSRCRLTISEMTKSAVKKSFDNARTIDLNLVDSFQARQIIDKYISYKIGEYLNCAVYRGVKVGRFRALLLKLIAQIKNSHLQGDFEIAEKFTIATLQSAALINLNFSTIKTRLIAETLFEGVSFEKSDFAGLITFPRGEEIKITTENRTPESVKDFLINNQFSLYELIYKKITGAPIETKFVLGENITEQTIIARLENLKIDWANVYSAGLSSLIRRRYVELFESSYKITDLGNQVLNALGSYFDEVFSVESYNNLNAQFKNIALGKADKTTVIKNYLAEFDKKFAVAWKSLGENPQPKDEPAIESDEVCEVCGRKMLIRRGRYGQFLSCSGYPDCKNARPLLNYVEQKCPKCGGRLTKRNFKGGKILYRCENYKTCDFNSWDEPQEKNCTSCGSTMFLHRFKDRAAMLYCGNEHCETRTNHPINKILQESQKRYAARRAKKSK